MKLQTFLTFVGLLSPALAQKILPGAYIAEIKGTNCDGFLRKARTSGINIHHRMTLDQDTAIFNGVSFDLEDDTPENRAKINSWGEVVSLSPIRLYDAVAPVARTIERDVTNTINRRAKKGDKAAWPPHKQGNVDRLHAEGLNGKGVRIAVIDTGIDYSHPALGGKYGPGNKVAFGTDLVGDAYTGSNTPVPDDDPIDCAGHGTHVAGIIAAIDPEFIGVAPEVTLGAYKVFGCPARTASNDVLISAFLKAQADGVDLITASIGGASGWSSDPWALVVQRIVESGTPCTIAAGNDGAQGLFYAAGAADAIGAISIGSVNNLATPEVLVEGKYSAGAAKDKKFGYSPSVGEFGDATLDVYIPLGSDGNISDGCAGLPADAGDLANKLVLVRRGTCTFDIKVQAAVSKGAKNVMLVNNVPGTISPSISVQNVNVGMISMATGAEFLAASKDTVSTTFSSEAQSFFTTSDNALTGGAMSIFSSWGPTNEMHSKPHISAPGGNILSTYPLIHGGYAVTSGTSMACPYVAGVVALYLQKAKAEGRKVTPAELRLGLTTTGTPLEWNDGTGKKEGALLAPVAQQGGGIVDAYKFLHSTTFVDREILEFNDTQHFRRSLDFKLTNKGDKPVVYRMNAISAASAYTLKEGSIVPQVFPPTLLDSSATVKIEPNEVEILPGQSKRIVVRVTPPELDSKRIPVYSGWINIAERKGGDLLKIPYLGVASAMNKAAVLNTEEEWPVVYNHTLGAINGTQIKVPAVAWALAMGSAVVRIDIASVSDEKLNDVTVFNDKVAGSFPGYPLRWNPRTPAGENSTSLWAGRVTKKQGEAAVSVPAGIYKFIFRALKITGRQDSGRDYERWESEPFSFEPFM